MIAFALRGMGLTWLLAGPVLVYRYGGVEGMWLFVQLSLVVFFVAGALLALARLIDLL